ncbi:MAG: hypothetical protein KAH07_08150 [Flavobacteriaceae bacterium]|nr:hypothetical protein [Flavobacteriaceae bacterium]
MNSIKKNLINKLDFFIFGWIINLAYPLYFRPKYNYTTYRKLFFYYFIPQKILRINGSVKWPVHFTSTVTGAHNIKKGIICDPGDNLGNYIQANNGISFGSNVELGPGTKIISSNHELENFSKQKKCDSIIIGDNVWIGANCVILPEVQIGSNVVIGAGSIVSKNIPSNSIAVGNPCKVIKHKEPYTEDFSKLKLNKRIPKEYLDFINQSNS